MSDLQCAATLLVARPGDVQQVSHLVEQMRARRIARVYSSSLDDAVQSAGLAASGLGVLSSVVDGLQEVCAGEDDGAVVSRFRDALEAVADLHRGESVLVFTHDGIMSSVVPRLGANVRNDAGARHLVPGAVPAEIDIDADGWRIVSWPGT